MATVCKLQITSLGAIAVGATTLLLLLAACTELANNVFFSANRRKFDERPPCTQLIINYRSPTTAGLGKIKRNNKHEGDTVGGRQLEAHTARQNDSCEGYLHAWLASVDGGGGNGGGQDEYKKNTATRAKRFILFDGAGVVKLVLGTSYPIELVDKQRSLSYFYNIQMQYTPPPRPIYWWSHYDSTTFAARGQRRYRWTPFLPHTPPKELLLARDTSREFIYAAIEAIFESKALPGTACLLRTICDVARLPFRGGSVFHALLNAIFRPSLPNVDEKYLNAHQAGVFGADCAQAFWECPRKSYWLEGISHFA